MEQAELLSTFNEQVDEYDKHRQYITRATAQAEKFSKAVIEKVILDHEIKSSEVADVILPLVPQMEGVIAGIDGEVDEIEAGKASSDEVMEELSLRLAIGEMSEEDFEEQTKELRETLETANGRLEELSEQRGTFSEALERWVGLAAAAGQDDGTTPEEDAEEEEEAAGDDATNLNSAIDDEEEHIQVGGIVDDVSAVFDSGAAAVAVADAGEAIEIGADENGDAGPSADVDFGFDSDEADEIGDGDGDGGVELNLVDEGEDLGASADEIGIDLGSDEPEEGGAQEERRALLLYQEGTAEEQIYPITDEMLTIGRGRDNDIQIKNDSKVSRFHCKIYRKAAHYYIEDNKSSNGTLVNGELITERRLFGGEEVIIGETFFRFRIM